MVDRRPGVQARIPTVKRLTARIWCARFLDLSIIFLSLFLKYGYDVADILPLQGL